MNIWIVTTGNSDVQLTTDENWLTLYDTEKFNYLDFFPTYSDVKKDIYAVSARVLGLVYEQEFHQYWDDLVFPLLDNFGKKLNEQTELMPDKIILLLTDQSILYPDYIDEKNSPCWKDTCTLQPIFEHYFHENFPKASLEFVVLKPVDGKGLDNWDSTLNLVQQELSNLEFEEEDEEENIIYVSHQASTPAVSSAVQFMTLANYGKKVRFLVSNEYPTEESKEEFAEIIDSSKYLRGIYIQQAKSLVSTSPGAAKKLLEKENIKVVDKEAIAELDDKVNFFNLKRVVKKNSRDFSIPVATQRIVDALDLIGIFFEQENYLQGITLISAAQETFMKVAILSKTEKMSVVIDGTSYFGKDVLKWHNEGLFLDQKEKNSLLKDRKEEFCFDILKKQLSFPEEVIIEYEKSKKAITRETTEKDVYNIDKNYVMLPWIQSLKPEFKSWPLLKWCGQYKREREDDLRNRLVHNLRGMEKSDVNRYLMGYEESYKTAETDDVKDIYEKKVKEPFLKAIKFFKLGYTEGKLEEELENLANSLY